MPLNETTRGMADLLLSLLGPLVFLAGTVIAIYIVARLAFHKPPPKSKPSQERHGELLR